MANDVEGLVSELQQIAADVRSKFGTLSAAQLNWKPAPEKWSVAQCLDHLIKSNEMFYGEIDQIAAGTRRNSLWEKWSPFTGFFGRLLVSSLEKDSRKAKAVAAASPPSELDGGIVGRFIEHQTEASAKIRSTEKADWQRTIMTSPFLSLFTYRLADAYQILIVHEKRHVRQAERVLKTDGFPVQI